MTTLACIFSVLSGMFKALRDRDLWGSDAPDSDPNKPWYASWAWYQKWSDTEAYIGPFPLDAWHNFDVACMASAVVAGGLMWLDYGWESIWIILAFALSSKWLFYHVLLMRHPIQELRQYFQERTL